MELIKVRLIAAAGCFHQRIRAWHEFFLVLNQDCELVSQLPIPRKTFSVYLSSAQD
jgi:hypothetical protein